jgi:hypothetical protein
MSGRWWVGVTYCSVSRCLSCRLHYSLLPAHLFIPTIPPHSDSAGRHTDTTSVPGLIETDLYRFRQLARPLPVQTNYAVGYFHDGILHIR